MESHDLCINCLGRLYGALSHGFSNKERGKAIVTMICLEDDRPREFFSISPSNCDICSGLFEELPHRAQKCWEEAKIYEFETYLVGSVIPDSALKSEQDLVEKFDLRDSEGIGHAYNRETGKFISALATREGRQIDVDFDNPQITILHDIPEENVELRVKPVYLYGRYRKQQRGLPQTEWPCNNCGGAGCEKCNFTGKQYPESVEMLVSRPVKEMLQASESTFHGAGREDVDALMKGNGRPFVIELKEPRKRSWGVQQLTNLINKSGKEKVEIEQLRFVNKTAVPEIKRRRVDKEYRAIVSSNFVITEDELQEALQSLEGKIYQRTPLRVSHRRADKIRVRKVKEATGKMVEGRKCEVRIRCSGGLYIKELVSGDQGRTKPSLAGLLSKELRVEKLDVMNILGTLEFTEEGEYHFVPMEPNT